VRVVSTVVLALAVLAPEALAQSAIDAAGREPGLTYPVGELSASVEEIGGTIQDLSGQVEDLEFVVADLGGKPKDLQVKETKTEIRIELAADVLFDFDKATLRPASHDALKQAAGIIRDNARGTVRVEGHTDAKGSDAYNQKLSERRASAVRDWLVHEEKLKNVRFDTRGFGAKRPVAPNTGPDGVDDPEGRQKNRRVEIIITRR
jgi:outer membrane protein OmpA-like peptidoglycan-associated protein